MCFSLQVVSAMIFHDVTVTVSFMLGKGMSATFSYSISENVPELRVSDRFLSEKTHENLRRDY